MDPIELEIKTIRGKEDCFRSGAQALVSIAVEVMFCIKDGVVCSASGIGAIRVGDACVVHKDVETRVRLLDVLDRGGNGVV